MGVYCFVYLFPPTRPAPLPPTFLAAFCLGCLAAAGLVNFLGASLAFCFSLKALMAWSLWAFLTSGFWFLLAMMSLRVAQATALVNFWVLLVLRLTCSSMIPFLCFRRYSTVQWLSKLYTLPSILTILLPWPGYILYPLYEQSSIFILATGCRLNSVHTVDTRYILTILL